MKSKATLGQKNPAAVALGRRGGLKGGPARAKSMTAKERSASAKKAALARWDGVTAKERSAAVRKGRWGS